MKMHPCHFRTLSACSAMLLLLSTAVHSVTVDDYYEDIFACDMCNLQALVASAGVEDQTIQVLAVDRARAIWQSYEVVTDLVGPDADPAVGQKTIVPITTPDELLVEINHSLDAVNNLLGYADHFPNDKLNMAVMETMRALSVPLVIRTTVAASELPLPQNIKPENADSALDLIGRLMRIKTYANAVSDYQSAKLAGEAASFNGSLLLGKLLTDINNVVKVVFSDGSSMEFEHDRLSHMLLENRYVLGYKPVTESGIDSEGNPFPEDINDVYFESLPFKLPDDGHRLDEWVKLLDRLGATINGLPEELADRSRDVVLTCAGKDEWVTCEFSGRPVG